MCYILRRIFELLINAYASSRGFVTQLYNMYIAIRFHLHMQNVVMICMHIHVVYMYVPLVTIWMLYTHEPLSLINTITYNAIQCMYMYILATHEVKLFF